MEIFGYTLAWYLWLAIILASVAAGFINAIAGGGTLVTFSTLTLAGVPPIPANITNTVAIAPGHAGATWAQRHNLVGQRQRMILLLPVAVVGGIVGSVLLLNTPEKLFSALVPWLILFASLLLAVQDPVRKWLVRYTTERGTQPPSLGWAVPAVFLAAVYGGYFGAGISIIFLAVLGVFIDDSLTRLNALKQTLSFVVQTASAIFFIFTGLVIWPIAIVMAIGAIFGGWLGGKFATVVKPATLRWTVVIGGVLVAIVYFVR